MFPLQTGQIQEKVITDKEAHVLGIPCRFVVDVCVLDEHMIHSLGIRDIELVTLEAASTLTPSGHLDARSAPRIDHEL